MANNRHAANPLLDTAANWVADNPILASNVMAIEIDTGRVKYGDGLTAYTSLAYSFGVKGSSPVATVNVREFGDGKKVTAVLTLTDFVVGALAGAAAALGLGNIVYAFPAGQHVEEFYSFSALSLKCAGTAKAADTGLGSVIASGAVSVLSGTSTFEDRLTGQAITTGTSGGTAVSALLAATAGFGTGIALNVAASIKNVFLNAAATWASNNTGNLTANGVIVITWTQMQ